VKRQGEQDIAAMTTLQNRIQCWLSAAAIGFFAGLMPASVSAAENSSVYTKLDFDKNCIPLATYEAGGTFSCQGYKGFPVLLSEGDLRVSVFFGHLGPWFNGTDGSEAFVSFSPFNNVANTIEWRLNPEGVPFAAILRWQISETDGSEGPGSTVLVVSRVGQPGVGMACPAGYVAGATPDANDVARQIADSLANDFDCLTTEAGWHGAVPAEPPATSRYFPATE
jgi:hypothetical protein